MAIPERNLIEPEEELSVRVLTGMPALWQDWVNSTQRIDQICNQWNFSRRKPTVENGLSLSLVVATVLVDGAAHAALNTRANAITADAGNGGAPRERVYN
jgi:hypothetical protein